MVRVGVSVEGPTEERFVKVVLAPYLMQKGLTLVPISMGGKVNLDRVRSELKKMSNSFDFVTTLYDFYGFQKKLPDEDKTSLENRIQEAVHGSVQQKIVPYIQMYEFEGLLFSCADSMESQLNENDVGDWCQKVLNDFDGNPEKINNSIETAPSKRLERHTGYRKTTHGPNIAREIGVEKIREKCSGFDNWLSRLEALVNR